MKKIIWTILLTMSVILSYAQTYSMRSTNGGFSIQLGAGASAWNSTESDVKTSYGIDLGLALAYGFNENIEVFGNANISFFPATWSDEIPSFEGIEHEAYQTIDPFELLEARLGLRYTFGATIKPLRFHANVAATFFSGDIESYDWFNDHYNTESLQGFGFTAGSGIKYHLSLPLAITLDATMTFGGYQSNLTALEEQFKSTYHVQRLNLGIVLYFNQL